jgi:cytochrome c oxidase subunit II
MRFRATKVGNYPIVCAELCGAYHGSMRTTAVVHTPEDYANWLASNQVAQQQDGSGAIASTQSAQPPT